MNVFIKISQLKKNKKLMKLIEILPDINNEEYDIESDIEDESDVESVIDCESNFIDLPIITLEDHEKFKDVNGEIFEIEVRGERSKDKILFKAKDLAEFFGMKSLVKNLIDNRKKYQYEIDYIILGNQLCDKGAQLESSKINIDRNNVFITLIGFIRVIFVSKSGNENIQLMFNWILDLVYTHKFGSTDEREELSKDLLKCILNEKLSGLYYINLGTFNELYDNMNISKEEYPPDVYGSFNIGKYGLSEDVNNRYKQHSNKKDGYGKFSSNIDFKWMILLSPSNLPKAESLLKNLLKSDGFNFDYNADNKNHTELIMFNPSKGLRLKKIFRQVSELFPSKENELNKIIEDSKEKYENLLNTQRLENELVIQSLKNDLNTQSLENELHLKDSDHKIEILEMRLKLMNLQKNN
jgi:hypothetical protein